MVTDLMEVGLVSFPSVMLFFLCKDVRKSGESLQVFRKCIARSFSVVIMMIIPADEVLKRIDS